MQVLSSLQHPSLGSLGGDSSSQLSGVQCDQTPLKSQQLLFIAGWQNLLGEQVALPGADVMPRVHLPTQSTPTPFRWHLLLLPGVTSSEEHRLTSEEDAASSI